MAKLTEQELWENVCRLYEKGGVFYSTVRKNRYKMVRFDEMQKEYFLEYESGHVYTVPFRDVYILYELVYSMKRLHRDYLRNDEIAMNIFGHKWRAPGASIYAILPLLDKNIKVESPLNKPILCAP